MERITESVSYQAPNTDGTGVDYYIKQGSGTILLTFNAFSPQELRAIADHQEQVLNERVELTPISTALLGWVNPLDPRNYDLPALREWIAKRLLANRVFADSKAGRRWRIALGGNDRNLLLIIGPKVRDAFFNDPNAPAPIEYPESDDERKKRSDAPTEPLLRALDKSGNPIPP